MRKTIPLVLIAPFLATPVFAQEIGAASLTIDGTTQSFPLSNESDFAGSAQFPSVNMVFNAPREGNETGFTKLSIGFELGGGAVRGEQADLMGKIDDEWTYFACQSEEFKGKLSLDIEETSVEGDLMTLKGRLACMMGTTVNFGRDIDMSSPMEVTGDFEATLERL